MTPYNFLFTAAFLYCSALSKTQAAPLANIYPAELIKVLDADTIKLRLELYPGLFKEVNLRVAGIDTPESRHGLKNGQPIAECEIAQGKKATVYARTLLQQSQSLMVRRIDPRKTKYSRRINGELWFDQNNYGQHLIQQGLAMTYAGGARVNWPCQQLPPLSF